LGRTVSNVTAAWRIEKPSYLASHRLSPAQAKGLRYEQKVGKALVRKFHKIELGQWFSFVDSNGPGICQPDIICQGWKDGRHIVNFALECKLTVTDEAFEQLDGLYQPMLRIADGVPTYGIVVCRNLSRKVDISLVVADLRSALRRSLAGEIPVLHWLDHTPL
jgi:hypothetical protein